MKEKIKVLFQVGELHYKAILFLIIMHFNDQSYSHDFTKL